MGFARQEYWSGLPLPSPSSPHSSLQIPYYYTVEVANRVKGLDLIDRMPEELQTEVHDIIQETVIKDHPQEKEM